MGTRHPKVTALGNTFHSTSQCSCETESDGVTQSAGWPTTSCLAASTFGVLNVNVLTSASQSAWYHPLG